MLAGMFGKFLKMGFTQGVTGQHITDESGIVRKFDIDIRQKGAIFGERHIRGIEEQQFRTVLQMESTCLDDIGSGLKGR
jgi:hypothetical protein